MLGAENSSPCVCCVFYKANVQSTLLSGSNTWHLFPVSLKVLEGFHIRAAWCMAGKRLMKLCDGTWRYPNSTDVHKDLELKTIVRHIAIHWLNQNIVNRITIS